METYRTITKSGRAVKTKECEWSDYFWVVPSQRITIYKEGYSGPFLKSDKRFSAPEEK